MTAVKSFFFYIKKNTVLSVAIAAAVTACIVPPDKAYLGYFDLKTLTCLFCVLAVVCTYKSISFFYVLSRKVVERFRNLRLAVLVLVYITFIGSMLIANDMAFTFIMQNIAANCTRSAAGMTAHSQSDYGTISRTTSLARRTA